MAGSPGLVLSGVALDRMLRGPQGPVYATVHRIVSETAVLARAKVRPSSVSTTPEFGRGGHLRDSYVSRMLEGGEGMAGSPLPQAAFVERGTVPHVIVPRKAKALRFYSVRIANAQGKPPATALYFKRVHHPGTKAQHILARSMIEAIERNLAH